mmetsp:Transcript_22245/g.33912  ORF Transcript_22245/g.33912 Transcript_22245/m.33912 type:complete len:112 (+) Transcript_22245:1208-1543(+)
MIVLGAQEPIPMARQFSGPVVTIDKAPLVFDDTLLTRFVWPKKDVVWNANALVADMTRKAAVESFIFPVIVEDYTATIKVISCCKVAMCFPVSQDENTFRLTEVGQVSLSS